MLLRSEEWPNAQYRRKVSSVADRLMLSSDQKAVLDAVCDSGTVTMTGEELKEGLGWPDTRLTSTVRSLIEGYPPKQILTARLSRMGSSPVEYVEEVTLGPDGRTYCDTGRPSVI